MDFSIIYSFFEYLKMGGKADGGSKRLLAKNRKNLEKPIEASAI